MGRPIDRSSDKDEVLRYAPKWARDVEEAFRQIASQSAPPDDAADGPVPMVPIGSPGTEHYASLAPTIMPEPPSPEPLPWQRSRAEARMRSRVSAARWFSYFFAIAFAAAVALVVVVQWPVLQRMHEDEGADANSFASRFRVDTRVPPSPTQDAAAKSKLVETARPLVTPAPAEGAPVKQAPHIETVPVSRVAEAAPTPPAPVPAAPTLARPASPQPTAARPQEAQPAPVEVASAKADQPMGNRASLAPSPPVREQKAAPAEAAPPARPLSADEIETLLEQGRKFLSVGDFVSARTLFGRIAEARDARGALALAETYDPILIAKSGVKGITPDIAKAREWYAKAQDLGSPDAGSRLGALAQNAR